MAHEDAVTEFVELFVRHQRRIYGYISTIVSNPNDAEDIFQETNLVLWRKRDTYEIGRDFLAWACGVARHVARNHWARQSRDRHWFNDDLLERIAQARAERSEWLDAAGRVLSDCLRRLNDKQRALLEMRYDGHRSMDEVAGDLNCPANTIYQRLHRIRQRLYDCVQLGLQREAS